MPRETTAEEKPPRVVLVAGAGRSGTSTFAGILRGVGLHVPTPEVAADATNPRGFFESQWVVDFHNELLDRVNVQVGDSRPVAWSQTAELAGDDRLQRRLEEWLLDQLAGADQLVVKDPRLSWFLDLWRAAAERAGAQPLYATLLRPAPEVVGSKRTYYNRRMHDAHGIAQWVNMMLGTERITRGTSRVFVRYHDLLADWESSLRRAGRILDLQAAAEPEADAVRRVADFVDPGLRRIQATWDDLVLPPRLEEIARETWSMLDALAGDDLPKGPGEWHRLDELRAEYDAFYAESEAVARSSVIAAGSAVPSRSGRPVAASAPAAAASRPPALLDRWARRTPHRIRAAVPVSVRRWIRRRMAFADRPV